MVSVEHAFCFYTLRIAPCGARTRNFRIIAPTPCPLGPDGCDDGKSVPCALILKIALDGRWRAAHDRTDYGALRPYWERSRQIRTLMLGAPADCTWHYLSRAMQAVLGGRAARSQPCAHACIACPWGSFRTLMGKRPSAQMRVERASSSWRRAPADRR